VSGDRILSGGSSSSVAVGFSRRTITLLVAALVGLATFMFLMSGGGRGSIAYAQDTTITAKGLADHECNSDEWHFVITQVDSEAQAPDSIMVEWANGDTEVVPLDDFTGKTAQYRTTSNLDSTVVSATAQIYVGWSGQFNLSHGPCGAPTPTPTKTETHTPTPTPSPTKTETHTPTPTPSPTKTETHKPTPTPTVSATESTAAPVPTAVPAGTDSPGGGSLAGLLGLVLATGGAVAGTALIARRRFLHE
jgi:hypothetical protein